MDKIIPIVINGQVEPFDSDKETHIRVNFDGGNSVYLPRITSTHVEKMITYDNTNNIKLHNIINFLYTVGQRWKNEEYSRRRNYIRELKNYMGYSEQMAKLEANWISMVLCSKSGLYHTVQNELGSRHMLDEWIPQDECYVKAFPKGKSLHLLAGNVPLSGVSSIVRAILTKNQCIIKTSSADPFTAHALAMSFIEVDKNHPITRSLSVLYWSHEEDTSLPEEILQSMDVVVAWGGSSAIEWAVKYSPLMIDVIKYGPKKSISIIDDPEDLVTAATGVAHDICFYDQQACFSSQNVFYMGDSYEEFKEELRNRLGLYARILPKARQSFDEQAVYSLTAKECQFAGLKVEVDPKQDWMIVESSPGVELNQPLGRCVYLHHATRFEDILPFVVKYQTQTVSMYPWTSVFKYRDALAIKGAERIVESGMNNIFRMGGSHDAMRPLQRLVRYISQERPFDFTTIDVAVEIEQTRFLEEDKFLIFVP
ncbi:long-chain-fatty-acyl-CoA reductase LuxC [Candidatus Enterovibrio escicola]|uniref:long-chain-fatty-acyl-CoA reductase LuxC n=1 Tax=Candidatus Enterovibrio escicola TaxID=1927127 RepID=UPI0012381DFA|nr:aldehyde dehydrogenase family protein [Candidatus Enterovibrio escacola]